MHDQRSVQRKHPGPEQERSGLSRPERPQRVEERKAAARVGGDVLDREIACHEGVEERERGNREGDRGCAQTPLGGPGGRAETASRTDEAGHGAPRGRAEREEQREPPDLRHLAASFACSCGGGLGGSPCPADLRSGRRRATTRGSARTRLPGYQSVNEATDPATLGRRASCGITDISTVVDPGSVALIGATYARDVASLCRPYGGRMEVHGVVPGSFGGGDADRVRRGHTRGSGARDHRGEPFGPPPPAA